MIASIKIISNRNKYYTSLMSLIQFLWSSTGSMEMAMTFTLRLVSSGSILASSPSSVVQTVNHINTIKHNKHLMKNIDRNEKNMHTRGEVSRVREKDSPRVAQPLMEFDVSLCGLCREVRGNVSNSNSAGGH